MTELSTTPRANMLRVKYLFYVNANPERSMIWVSLSHPEMLSVLSIKIGTGLSSVMSLYKCGIYTFVESIHQ